MKVNPNDLCSFTFRGALVGSSILECKSQHGCSMLEHDAPCTDGYQVQQHTVAYIVRTSVYVYLTV